MLHSNSFVSKTLTTSYNNAVLTLSEFQRKSLLKKRSEFNFGLKLSLTKFDKTLHGNIFFSFSQFTYTHTLERFCHYFHIQKIRVTKNNNIPVGIYIFKVNNRNTRARCEICSKLAVKTPERRSSVLLLPYIILAKIIHTSFVPYFLFLR